MSSITASFSRARSGHRGPDRRGSISARCPGPLSVVTPADWNALLGDANAPVRHGFLRAWEQSELEGMQSHPLVADTPEASEPVGACPGYVYDLDLVGVRWPAAVDVVRPLRRLWPRLLMLRTYELGTTVPLADPFLLGGDLAPVDVIDALISQAVTEARDAGAPFLLVQNFSSCDGPVADVLRRHGFAAASGPPTAVLPLPYTSFDDYLAAMRAPYRRRARQAIKRTEGLTFEHQREFGELAEVMADLWRSIYDRAREIRREVLTPDFFRGVSDLRETSALVARRDDGSIAAFALLLDNGPTLSFAQCGFEQAAGRGEGVYFRLLYEIVRLGIEHDFEEVDLGITTLEPKLDVGAVPVPLFAWIRHLNPLVQTAVRAAQPLLQTPAPPARSVFKAAPASAQDIIEQHSPAGI